MIVHDITKKQKKKNKTNSNDEIVSGPKCLVSFPF